MRTLYLILLVFAPLALFGQNKYTISYKNESYQQFIKHPKTEFKDSLSALKYIRNLQFSAISKGYATASVDTIAFTPGNAFVDFHLGNKLGSVIVTANSEELRFIRKNSRINEKLISQIPFNPTELASTLTKIQNAYLNNGYPFVSLQLVNHEFIDDDIRADLKVDRGPYNEWKKINVKGDSSISSKYISNLLNIRKGTKYEESEISKISTRIEQVPFLKEI